MIWNELRLFITSSLQVFYWHFTGLAQIYITLLSLRPKWHNVTPTKKKHKSAEEYSSENLDPLLKALFCVDQKENISCSH